MSVAGDRERMGLQRVGASLFGVGLLAATLLAVVPDVPALVDEPLVECSAVPWLPGCTGSVAAHPALLAAAVALVGLLIAALGAGVAARTA